VAHAEVLAFPSRFEGFGAPVLEAMHLGTPVVAADATALPEVVADAGVLVPAGDPVAVADAIDMLLRDSGRADALRLIGKERAAQFTARKAAEAVAHAYGLALS
jgi:glycosyltransferase involved in cell wall biosynthesis